MKRVYNSNQRNANFIKKNRFSEFRNWTKWNSNWFRKDTNDQKMKIVYQCQRISIISEIHEFIKNYFSKTISLINLTIKIILWWWKKQKQNAFNQLQITCITNSIFKMFDTEKSIRLKIDASNLIIETCINQKQNDKWHSITYFSRKFSSAKQNYDIHDKKLLAIVVFLKQWKVYAKETSKFTIFMNHKNLVHFIITKQFNKRQTRWSKLLKQYKFTIFCTSKKRMTKQTR